MAMRRGSLWGKVPGRYGSPMCGSPRAAADDLTIGRPSVTKLLKTLAATAVAIGAASAVPALAQNNPAPPAPHAETKAAFTAGLQAKFKSLDANGDGNIEASEADAANAKAAQRTEAALATKMDAEFARSTECGWRSSSGSTRNAISP